jgi:hypothetical protein
MFFTHNRADCKDLKKMEAGQFFVLIIAFSKDPSCFGVTYLENVELIFGNAIPAIN